MTIPLVLRPSLLDAPAHRSIFAKDVQSTGEPSRAVTQDDNTAVTRGDAADDDLTIFAPVTVTSSESYHARRDDTASRIMITHEELSVR